MKYKNIQPEKCKWVYEIKLFNKERVRFHYITACFYKSKNMPQSSGYYLIFALFDKDFVNLTFLL